MGLPGVRNGAFHAFFVYDVADTVDLARLERLGGEGVAREPLKLRREASTSSIEFPDPPIVARLPADRSGFELRVKVYDYGVVSIRCTQRFTGDWSAFAAFTRELRSDDALVAAAREALDGVLAEIGHALDDAHDPVLEDYFVFQVDRFEEPIEGPALLREHASELASLILCEERPLVAAAVAETLRVNFGYFPDDLAVVQWDVAFLYDRGEGARSTLDILEFANTQLVELRTYDARLDIELDTIYKLDPKPPVRRLGRREAQEAADRLRFLVVDIAELTDRSSNSLKIIGDAYYARLFRGAAGRLGLGDWQQQIDAKLATVNEIYRFFTDQAQTARGEFLELVVIILIALEVVLGLITLKH